MANPLLFSLKSVTLPGVGVGVLAAMAAKKYGRPLVVETLRLGFQVKDGTERMWNEARSAAAGMADEARGSGAGAKKTAKTSAA